MKIVFGGSQFTEFVPVATGINPKFSFDKLLTVNIRFENLSKTFLTIV